MNASNQAAPASKVNLMSGEEYRESLRQYKPKVFVDGREVSSVADEPAFGPGVNALAFTYDYARLQNAPLSEAAPTARPVSQITRYSFGLAVGAGVPLHEAVLSASLVPAEVIGHSEVGRAFGALRPGYRADVLVTDRELRVLPVQG